MAKATVITIPPTPVKPVKTVVFELSEAETMTLALILNNIGGSPATSARRYVNAIQQAMPSEYINRVDEVNDAGVGELVSALSGIWLTDASKSFVESV